MGCPNPGPGEPAPTKLYPYSVTVPKVTYFPVTLHHDSHIP